MNAVVIAPDASEREILAFALRHAGISVASSGDHRRVLKNWEDHQADIDPDSSGRR